jgi:RimJ/RimL family protein N-acetyltransferase
METRLPYRILTARLLLRCWEPGDAAALKDAIDTSLDHLRAWMPWAHQEPESIDQKTERIIGFRTAFAERKCLIYGIFRRIDTRLLGCISINWRVATDVVDLGYWLRAGAENNGYATEATVGCLTASFFCLGMPVAEIFCDPLNRRSAAIPRRIGFREQEHAARSTAESKDRMSQIWRLDQATFAKLHPENESIIVQDALGARLPRLGK